MCDGPLILSEGVGDGSALRAAHLLGCDLAFVGTRFIATLESRADHHYKQALVAATLDHVAPLAGPVGGLTANFIRDTQWSAGHSVSAVERIVTVRELVRALRREWDAARLATDP